MFINTSKVEYAKNEQFVILVSPNSDWNKEQPRITNNTQIVYLLE